MKNNNIQFWGIVIIVALVAGVLGAVVANGITGNVIKTMSYSKPYGLQDIYTKAEIDDKLNSLRSISPSSSNANSCNADNQCEVKSLNATGLSQIDKVVMDDNIISTLYKEGVPLRLTSNNEKVIIDKELVVSEGFKGNLSVGNLILKDNTISTKVGGAFNSLILSPANKYVYIDAVETKISGISSINGTIISEGGLISENSNEIAIMPRKGKGKVYTANLFANNLSAINLIGSGNAYACVDSTGRIYRSITPCI